MPRRAVLIVHGEDRPGDGDRASARLGELGYQLDWRHPDAGDELPESDESVAVTVIYGGGKPEDEKTGTRIVTPGCITRSAGLNTA